MKAGSKMTGVLLGTCLKMDRMAGLGTDAGAGDCVRQQNVVSGFLFRCETCQTTQTLAASCVLHGGTMQPSVRWQ